jgi:periplasmic divalent cation tolerance protein
MGADDDARVVLITAPELDTARRLARGLVEGRLAACANLVSGIESIYRWRGAVESANEVLLVVKTRAGRVAEIERFLAREHPYELPECVALAPEHVEPRYLAWILAESSEEPSA